MYETRKIVLIGIIIILAYICMCQKEQLIEGLGDNQTCNATEMDVVKNIYIMGMPEEDGLRMAGAETGFRPSEGCNACFRNIDDIVEGQAQANAVELQTDEEKRIFNRALDILNKYRERNQIGDYTTKIVDRETYREFVNTLRTDPEVTPETGFANLPPDHEIKVLFYIKGSIAMDECDRRGDNEEVEIPERPTWFPETIWNFFMELYYTQEELEASNRELRQEIEDTREELEEQIQDLLNRGGQKAPLNEVVTERQCDEILRECIEDNTCANMIYWHSIKQMLYFFKHQPERFKEWFLLNVNNEIITPEEINALNDEENWNTYIEAYVNSLYDQADIYIEQIINDIGPYIVSASNVTIDELQEKDSSLSAKDAENLKSLFYEEMEIQEALTLENINISNLMKYLFNFVGDPALGIDLAQESQYRKSVLIYQVFSLGFIDHHIDFPENLYPIMWTYRDKRLNASGTTTIGHPGVINDIDIAIQNYCSEINGKQVLMVNKNIDGKDINPIWIVDLYGDLRDKMDEIEEMSDLPSFSLESFRRTGCEFFPDRTPENSDECNDALPVINEKIVNQHKKCYPKDRIVDFEWCLYQFNSEYECDNYSGDNCEWSTDIIRPSHICSLKESSIAELSEFYENDFGSVDEADASHLAQRILSGHRGCQRMKNEPKCIYDGEDACEWIEYSNFNPNGVCKSLSGNKLEDDKCNMATNKSSCDITPEHLKTYGSYGEPICEWVETAESETADRLVEISTNSCDGEELRNIFYDNMNDCNECMDQCTSSGRSEEECLELGGPDGTCRETSETSCSNLAEGTLSQWQNATMTDEAKTSCQVCMSDGRIDNIMNMLYTGEINFDYLEEIPDIDKLFEIIINYRINNALNQDLEINNPETMLEYMRTENKTEAEILDQWGSDHVYNKLIAELRHELNIQICDGYIQENIAYIQDEGSADDAESVETPERTCSQNISDLILSNSPLLLDYIQDIDRIIQIVNDFRTEYQLNTTFQVTDGTTFLEYIEISQAMITSPTEAWLERWTSNTFPDTQPLNIFRLLMAKIIMELCSEEYCNNNQYNQNGVCLPCPPGTQKIFSDTNIDTFFDFEDRYNGNPDRPNTTCDIIICGENEYALNHVCTACPDGTTAPPGDNASSLGTPCI